jgi:phosphoribosylglycinamide formyltransferase-1
MKKRIVIFASGSGSNTENIVHYFENKPIEIVAIYCNNPKAGVIERAKRLEIPCILFNKNEFSDAFFLEKIQIYSPDLIVLAGFLWLIPGYLIEKYPIINIHPALLPKFGGKGMYGMHVHEAVIKAKENKSGITIHYVNEHYDDGNIIAQFECNLSKDETPKSLAEKIHQLEYTHFPATIEKLII